MGRFSFAKSVIIETICDSYTLKKAVKISILVGTLLNIINQGDFILQMEFEKLNYFKLILTYFVPFLVSAYTAININMRLKVGHKLMAATTLTCKGCKKSLFVEKFASIPECENCKDSTSWTAN